MVPMRPTRDFFGPGHRLRGRVLQALHLDSIRPFRHAFGATLETVLQKKLSARTQQELHVIHHAFGALGLSHPLLRALDAIGYRTPTPIQARAVPPLLAGHDLLGIAQTGTGKTAAFGLPLLQRLAGHCSPEAATPRSRNDRNPRCPRALILAPTRELALQIGTELGGYGRYLPLALSVIFGGVGARPQIDRLRAGVDVLVATPGRLLDLIGQGHADLGRVEVLVLDEADRLLDMGFIRDVRRIVQQTPKTRQSLLFSATMPREVASLAAEILNRPVRVEVTPKVVTVERIRQRLIRAPSHEKRWVLEHLLREEAVSRAIVFTRTKHGANKVARNLVDAGIAAEAIHGNKSQSARQRALDSFKGGATSVLVATDIAARGIDVQGVSHVINYELPDEPESYVHRIGRTGRAGAGGVAWSLYDPAETNRLRGIERLVGRIPDEAEAALAALPKADARAETGGSRRAEPGNSPSSGSTAGRRGRAATADASRRTATSGRRRGRQGARGRGSMRASG